MRRRVVITGLGIICPQGIKTKEVWQNLLEGKTVVEHIPEYWHNFAQFKSKIWSPLPPIDFSKIALTRIDKLRNDLVSLLCFGAAVEALYEANLILNEDNGWLKHTLDANTTGIFIGTGIGGSSTMLSNHVHHLLDKPKKTFLSQFQNAQGSEMLDKYIYPKRVNPFTVSMVMPNAPAAFLGIKLKINGPCNSFAVACASGTAAIGKAFHAIREGKIVAAITGGCEYLSDECGALFRSFDTAGVLTQGDSNPQTANRPFDENHTGFLYSEGAAAIMVLEELDQAVARKAPIIAEVVGYGETFDAHSMLNPEPEAKQTERMVSLALQDANLQPSDINFINSHGTGTRANDEAEAKLIERVFGHRVAVTATKSITGHTIGASGAIEAGVTALSIKNQLSHGCLNLDDPIADLNFIKAASPINIKHGLSHSFAFGGHNAALIMSRFD